jgi:hypothetical protein
MSHNCLCLKEKSLGVVDDLNFSCLTPSYW